MIIPISESCAKARGFSPRNGYAKVKLNGEWLNGQLSKMVSQHVQDVRSEKIQVFSRISMFDIIKSNDLHYLSTIDDPEKYADRLEKILSSIDGLIEENKQLLYSHELNDYCWTQWDNPTISVETWLNDQCKKMREQGLVVKIGSMELPYTLLRSMGARLVGKAQQKGIVATNH